MAVDRDLGKSLNLFLATPDMVWREQADGRRIVTRPETIGPDDGLVWAFATTTTANGIKVDSVITFNAAAPTALTAAYWHVNGKWLEPAYPKDRPALFGALGVTETGVFPYSWSTHVPLGPPASHGISATRQFLRKFF